MINNKEEFMKDLNEGKIDDYNIIDMIEKREINKKLLHVKEFFKELVMKDESIAREICSKGYTDVSIDQLEDLLNFEIDEVPDRIKTEDGAKAYNEEMDKMIEESEELDKEEERNKWL